MKKQTSNGRTFYRILITLLSCVLIMSAVTSALIAYQNRHNVSMHTGVLTNSMSNGAEQIDGFWQNAAAFLLSLSNSEQLTRLSTQPLLNLQLSAEAQRAATKTLSSYLSSVDYAKEVFIYLYGKDYLLTPQGVTKIDTYFNNRYEGDLAAFSKILRGVYPFKLSQWPFAVRTDNADQFNASSLALMQTLYGDNRAIGTFVVTVDADMLEETISRFLTIPNSVAFLLLDGEPLADAGAQSALLDALPAGEYSRHIPGTGVIVRKASRFMSGMEYVAIDAESNVMPDSSRMMQSLLLLLAAATLVMGATAFFATRKLYTPLRALLREFDNPVDARTDECKLLLQSIHAVNSNYARARNALDYSSPLVRDALLYHLLRGTPREDDLLVERYLPAPFSQEHFYVFVVAAAFPGDAAREGGPSGISIAMARLKMQCAQRLLSALRTGDEEFALITYPLPPQEHAQICADIASICAQLETELPGGIAVCAHGAGVAHIDCIDACFREAREIIRSRPITSEYAFLGGPESQADKPACDAYLPADYATTLAALLRGNDLSRAWDYVGDLLARNKRPDVSAAQYTKVAVTLNQQLFWAASSRVPSLAGQMIEIRPSHALIPADQLAGILRDNLSILFTAETQHPVGSDRDNITRYVRENIAGGVNLSSTAEHFGYNANYFSRYFKQLTGVTFTSYLNRARIERACGLLSADDGLSINEIAARCGYNSAGQFITTFEKLMGITPGAYRKLPAPERSSACAAK